MKRVLLLSSESVRPRMAGMAIRCWETARALDKEFDVTLAIPNAPEECPPLPRSRVVRYGPANLDRLSRDADAVVVTGHVSDAYLDHGARRPLVVDLYDPFPVENLNYLPTLGREPYNRDRATIARQMRHGDFFLSSSPEQRLFYLGMLLALGRLGPERYFADFTLDTLIDVVPFGVPEAPPLRGEPLLRGVIPGIGDSDPVVLFGGLYEWHDPETLLQALPALLASFPNLRVVFSVNPNPESTPQETFHRTVESCRREGWLDRHVFFLPWVPYLRRADLYLESTLAVVLHRPRFETELSMRTRVLDALWAGLPVVATQGGSASRLLVEHDIGRTVPVGDPQSLATTLTELLRSEEARAELASRGRRWAELHSWDRVLEPLRRFLSDPREDPHKSLYPASALASSQPLSRRILRRLDRRLRRRRPKS